MLHAMHRHFTPLAIACIAVWMSLGSAAAQDAEPRSRAWDKEAIKLTATLPVQHRGRVKPLESLAGLNLLMVNGKRKLKIDSGETLKPTAWILDCFFHPEQAKAYRSFRIENDGVLTALELDARKKRDWYSYDELEGAKNRLHAAASRAMRKETADRSAVERQTLKLSHDLRSFESLVGFLNPLRRTYSAEGSDALAEVLGASDGIHLSTVAARMPAIYELRGRMEAGSPDRRAIDHLLSKLETSLVQVGNGPAMFPPADGAEDAAEWWGIGDVMLASVDADIDVSKQVEMLAAWERLEETKDDVAAFESELVRLHDTVVGLATARGEYEHIPLEVKLHRWNPFGNSLALYLLGFLLLAGTWLAPRSRALRLGVWGSVGLATALLIGGIVLRSIIRERPPIVTLYDTILFVTACTVVVSLVMEWMTRQRIGIGVATVLGVCGMFLAGRYELKEVASAGDTMASVVAVLDTNYYLAIHVTTIAMGYSGGLLAAGIAHVWIIGQLLGFRRGDTAFYKSITRMTYGVICFCLLFSIFGTIMGGVWANDSWGRFWGWDPKENGALLICIWQLLVLHARMGGFIRDRGLAVMAVLGGVVVTISWWGVNLLNVGLHSYGFTSGVAQLLLGLWCIEGVVILLSAFDHFRRGDGGQPPQVESAG